MKRRWARIMPAALLAAVAAMGTAAIAEDAWVQQDLADLRGGKGALYPRVAQLPKGTQVTVVAREGDWVKVQAGGKEGYLFGTALSPQKVGGGGNLLAAMGSGVNTSDTAAGAAGRGLRPEAEKYAANKNLDPKVIDRLIAVRNGITPQQWEQFCAAGKVGPNAK